MFHILQISYVNFSGQVTNSYNPILLLCSGFLSMDYVQETAVKCKSNCRLYVNGPVRKHLHPKQVSPINT